jgi:parallel beta-helix repeat protein
MRRLIFALLLSATLLSPALAAKRVALVIGNSSYEHITDLLNPVNDANLMESVLKEAGFEVIRKNDLDQRGMKLAMVEFGRKLKQGADASMFYYAGHGFEVDGRNYLIPVDSNTESKEEADIHNVEVNDFLSLMENSGVALNIVVLDACRNNPFRSMRSAGGGLAPVRAPSGTYVAYSTAPGSVAADGTGANSPFTQALAESIREPGLSLESVFKKTRTKVRNATGGEQVPFDSSAIEGEFYFVGGPDQGQQIAAVEPVPQPVVQEPAQAPVVRGDDGQAAYAAAGGDITLLRAVAADYSKTVYGQLAAARVKILESQLALANPKVVAPVVATPEPPPLNPNAIRVMADGTGDYKTIADAIAAAKSGGRIELMPGTHTGGVVIDKPVEIVGLGDFNSVIWQAEGVDVVQWKASSGLISNLTIHQTGKCEKTCNAIYFSNGSATVENAGLTSDGGATVYVQGANASPTISKSNIYNSKEGGIYFEAEATGTIEFNDFYNNGFAGIELKSGSNPTIKGNKIRDGKQGGVLVNTDGRGIFEANEVFGNALSGFEIKDNADPTLRNNKIYNQKESGLYIHAKALGSILNNEIYGNGHSNINIGDGAKPLLRDNRIYDGKEGGVFFEKGGMGTLEGNDIFGNALANVEIRDASDPVIRKNTIRDGKQGGVFVHENGKGVFEENDITGNTYAGVEVKSGGNPVFRNNRINRNVFQAFYIYEKGRGSYTDNDLTANSKGAWNIEKTAGKIKRSGNKE